MGLFQNYKWYSCFLRHQVSYLLMQHGKTAIRTCKIVSTANNDLEYMIAVTPLDEETQILQEFSENRFFSVPINDKHGIFFFETQDIIF